MQTPALSMLMIGPLLQAGDPPPDSSTRDLAAWWSFADGAALDAVSGVEDELSGNFEFMPRGARGSCLRFDGFTTLVRRPAEQVPELSGPVTFSAWVALGAYPWNRSPVLCQRGGKERGFTFGLDHRGRFGLQASIAGEWVECLSTRRLELRRWHQLAATHDPESGLRLFLDGEPAGEESVLGELEYARDVDLHLGRNHEKMLPVERVREWARFPSWWSHDGMLDEVRIHRRALSAEEIAALCASEQPAHAPDIPPRRFPDVTRGPRRFGAYPARLEYYEQWDDLWQMAGPQDVVVGFDTSPAKLVFWRGTHYSPCWVTENGKWMADQSLETGIWPDRFDEPVHTGAVGCCEHMSDTECRFAQVRILENTAARVVVHWRYAMVDCDLKFAAYDEVAGRGHWGDEFYYVYPDTVSTRHVVGWWPDPHEDAHQETIFLSEPGTRPEDNCELEAITLVGWEGESATYSWADGFPTFGVPDPVIQMVNLKAEHRPFMIFGRDSWVSVFAGEVREEYSRFPWWNHWPVARIHSDGRYAEAPDRAAHSSLTQTTSSFGTYLYGTTNRPAAELLPLARSWISPPPLELASPGFESQGYDRNQRAYVLRCTQPGEALELTLAGSAESPVFNPALVIQNWGTADAAVRLEGEPLPPGKAARLGHRYHMDGCDLVIWLEHQAARPTLLSITPDPR